VDLERRSSVRSVLATTHLEELPMDDAQKLKRKAHEARLKAATTNSEDVSRVMLSVAGDLERQIGQLEATLVGRNIP
jgi:hypothetical protein